MFEWVTGIVHDMGAIGVALLMLLENVLPPVPSELVMPLAGFVATRGRESLWAVIAAGSAGAFLGAIGWYWVGRRMGERRLREWVDRHGRWLTLCGDDIDKASRWFARHGPWAVLVGRLVPGVRTFVSIPAGFARMPIVPFALATAIGTVGWSAALAFAGRALGANYEAVERYIDPVSWGVLAILVTTIVVRAVRQRRWRRAQATEKGARPRKDARPARRTA
jgi:membrane protein DedA with SNARE-associated domain